MTSDRRERDRGTRRGRCIKSAVASGSRRASRTWRLSRLLSKSSRSSSMNRLRHGSDLLGPGHSSIGNAPLENAKARNQSNLFGRWLVATLEFGDSKGLVRSRGAGLPALPQAKLDRIVRACGLGVRALRGRLLRFVIHSIIKQRLHRSQVSHGTAVSVDRSPPGF